MTQRLNPFQKTPDAYRAMLGLSAYVEQSGLEHSLLELVKMRASQMNGCAYCLHMHSADARKAGESEARLYLLAAWRESQLYSPRERAALRWTEELTQIRPGGPDDAAYEELRAHFDEKQSVDLTWAITMINGWNRMNVGFRTHHPQDSRPAEAA